MAMFVNLPLILSSLYPECPLCIQVELRLLKLGNIKWLSRARGNAVQETL